MLIHENAVGKKESWVELLLATNRKFHKVKIDEMLELEKNQSLEIYQRIGSHIRELHLLTCVLDNFNLFLDVMKTMPNLKKLIMRDTATLVDFNHLPDAELPVLAKLDTLEFVKSQYEILKCFNRAQLKTLKILSSTDEDRQAPEPLVEFLATQKKLETLALRSIEHGKSKLFQTPVDDFIPFRLKKLSLQGIKLRESPNDYNNLLKFMKLHARTLDELELGRKFPDFVYEFIFSQFKSLKTLRFMANEIPKIEDQFYERLEENKNITKLVVNDTSPPDHTDSGHQPLKELLKRLPNVASLKMLDYCDKDIMHFVAENLKQLKNLDVKNFNGSIFDGLQLSSLTSLKIFQVDGNVDWDGFTKANVGITDLFIEVIYDSNDFNIESIVENLKLRNLVILESGIVGNKKFFDAIRKCSELKSLEMDENSLALDISEVADIPLRLRSGCHADSSVFWNDSDYSGGLPHDGDNWNVVMGEMLDPFDMQLLLDDLNFYDEDDDDDYDPDEFYGEDYDYDEPENYEDNEDDLLALEMAAEQPSDDELDVVDMMLAEEPDYDDEPDVLDWPPAEEPDYDDEPNFLDIYAQEPDYDDLN